MATRIRIHPTAKSAAYVVIVGLAIIGLVFAAKRLSRESNESSTTETKLAPVPLLAAIDNDRTFPPESAQFLAATIDLAVSDVSRESSWSDALATFLSGTTEAPVDQGRIDVSTSTYAIEVDRLEKWHEGIGQAAHYGLATGKIPVVAIMLPPECWPLSFATKNKLALVDKTCMQQQVKLVLLRSTPLPKTEPASGDVVEEQSR